MARKSQIRISRYSNGTQTGNSQLEGQGEYRKANNPFGADNNQSDVGGVEGTAVEPLEFNEVEPGKSGGRRGRPPGSKNKTSAQATVFEESVTRGKTEAHSEEKKTRERSSKRKKMMSEDEAVQITQTMLTVLEGFTVSLLGEEARINDTEKLLMFSSIPKMLSTISESAVESVSKILYPATALIAVGIYSVRLGNIYTEKKKSEQGTNFDSSQRAVNTVSQPVNETNSNGSEKPFSTDSEDKTIWQKGDLTPLRRGF